MKLFSDGTLVEIASIYNFHLNDLDFENFESAVIQHNGAVSLGKPLLQVTYRHMIMTLGLHWSRKKIANLLIGQNSRPRLPISFRDLPIAPIRKPRYNRT